MCDGYNKWGLIIIGSGPSKAKLLEDYDFPSAIYVDAVFNHKELSKYYLLSDIVVFPGYATLSTHFAMCFGKAIVSSQYGNEAEYIIDGINGYKYAFGDVKMLEDKLSILMGNKSLREQFGRESEKIVREKINVRNMAQTINKALYCVINKKNGQ